MKFIKEHIKAIIFDMDGTIIHTEHLWAKATLNTLTKRGITEFTFQETAVLQSFSGIGMRNAMTLLKETFKLSESVDDLVKETEHDALHQFTDSIKFIDGFELFHKQLREHNIPTALATNADLKSLTHLSEKLGFQQFFGTHLYSIGHVDNKAKPDPSVFLHAAKQLGAKPEECLVFEDSLFGFQAAKAAGMKVIGIKNEKNAIHLEQVHHAVNHYHEAEEALRFVIHQFATKETTPLDSLTF